jgi:hypothetical protein
VETVSPIAAGKALVMRRLPIEGTKLGSRIGQALRALSNRVSRFSAIGSDFAEALETRSLKYLFESRADDIFIVTYPRSGTTWLQMIVYQLLTGGEAPLDHISKFSPYFEASPDTHGTFEGKYRRVFKSHLDYQQVPHRDCRYLYVSRDVRDVVISCFNHERDRRAFNGTFDEFLDRFMAGDVRYGSWYSHVEAWWRNRDRLAVLFLTYEDLSLNLERNLRRIASFLEIPLDERRVPKMVEHSSFEFMKRHEQKFDPVLAPVAGWVWQPGQFIRQGKAGGFKRTLSPNQEQRLRNAFVNCARRARLPEHLLQK